LRGDSRKTRTISNCIQLMVRRGLFGRRGEGSAVPLLMWAVLRAALLDVTSETLEGIRRAVSRLLLRDALGLMGVCANAAGVCM